MNKPKSILGFTLLLGYLMFVIAIIIGFRCEGGEMFCGTELGIWIAAFPWTWPFVWAEDTTFHYYGMFVLSVLGIGTNIVILYLVGSFVSRKWKTGRLS